MKCVGGVAVLIISLIGCGDDGTASTQDAGSDANPLGGDAPAIEQSCPGSKRFDLVGATPAAAASDGTTLYIAQTTTTGQGQLVSVPLSGGAPTVVALAASGTFALAANGDAVFYASNQANGSEVHQRVGSIDTVLATLTLEGDFAIAANATDVYIVDTTKVVSVSRSGAATQTPTSIADSTGSPRELIAGATTVSWIQGGGFVGTSTLVPIAALGQAVTLGSGAIHVGGDTAYQYLVQMETSRAHQDSLATIYPAAAQVWTGQAYLSSNTFVAADADHIYFLASISTMSPMNTYTTSHSISAWSLDDAHHPTVQTQLCNYDPFAMMEQQTGTLMYARQDAHFLYAFDASSVLAISKP
ncbi:MAG TPA: hypothetical protein VGM90_23485 [Kofleriaceae bacterium]